MRDVTHMTFDAYYDTFEIEPADPYEGLTFLAQTGTGSILWADDLGRYWIDSGRGPARVKPQEIIYPCATNQPR